MEPVPREVEWISTKSDGSAHRRARVRVVHVDEIGTWVSIGRGTTVEGPDRSYPQPCDTLTLLPADGGWHLSWLFDFDPVMYADVTTSTIVDGGTIRSVDLDLDVVRYRDGRVETLDRDELRAHTAAMEYPAATVAGAEATAAWLVERMAAGHPPFTVVPPAVGPAGGTRAPTGPFDDWVRAPNIAGDPDTYELENEAIARDGRLDSALYELAPWDGLVLVDIGCGTGFWLPRYADRAALVIGVEPDPALIGPAMASGGRHAAIEVRSGSAEHLPLATRTIDIAHARFAYFFGPGAEVGLAETARVLRPDGTLLVVDNSWRGGDFARLLAASSVGNAAIDPDETDRWWAERGAIRHEIEGGWRATSEAELERILRLEFPAEVVDGFVTSHTGAAITYHFAVYEWHP